MKCLTQNIIILKITDARSMTTKHNFFFQFIFTATDSSSLDSKILLILEISQVCCSVLVWFFFISKQAPLVWKKAEDRILEYDTDDNDVNDSHNDMSNRHEKKQNISLNKKFIHMIRNFTIYMTYLLFDPLILYYLFYTSFAILGMFNPVFIAILLLDVFFRFY